MAAAGPACTIDGQVTTLDTFIGADEVLQAVAALDARLAAGYAKRAGNVLAIGVLNGAVPLMGQLMAGKFAATVQPQFDTVRLKSRTHGTDAPTSLRLLKDTELPVAGRHTIVIEDLVDTGFTLSQYLRVLQERGAASLAVVALIDKAEARKHPLPEAVATYFGFRVAANLFVAGFGMDIDERFRGGLAIRAPRSQLVTIPQTERYQPLVP